MTNFQEKSDPWMGTLRAFGQQGSAMGWGDEAEALAKSKFGGLSYEQELADIQREMDLYAKEHPVLNTVLPIAGGIASGLGAARLVGPLIAGGVGKTAGALGKLAATVGSGAVTGATSGAISGGGTARPGEGWQDAKRGAVIGGALGAGLPLAFSGMGALARWARDRLSSNTEAVERAAAERLAKAVHNSGQTPQQIAEKMAADRALNVPSRVANANQSLVDLTDTVAQRSGKARQQILNTLRQQTNDAPDRAKAQLATALQPGDYWNDLIKMKTELRAKAKPAYDAAYAFGDVDDPKILEILKNPKFQDFWNRARATADYDAAAARARGLDPSPFELPQIYKPGIKTTPEGVPILELNTLPDVRTLDYIARGADDAVTAGFKGTSSMGHTEANALKNLRDAYMDAIESATGGADSLYAKARRMYSDDSSVIRALESGRDDFRNLDFEEIARKYGGNSQVSNAEKEAFRTGAARNLFGFIDDPANRSDVANKIIGSTSTSNKLKDIVANTPRYEALKAALQRESDLFKNASKIAGGSATLPRALAQQAFEGDTTFKDILLNASPKGITESAFRALMHILGKAPISEAVTDKIATRLMSNSPDEVANLVRLLDSYNAKEAVKAPMAVQRAVGAAIAAPPIALQAIKPKGSDSERAPIPEGMRAIEAAIAAEEGRSATAQSPATDETRGMSAIERAIFEEEKRNQGFTTTK